MTYVRTSGRDASVRRPLRWAPAVAFAISVGACSPAAVRVDLTPVAPTPTGVRTPGQIVWHDLATDDVDGMKAFYGDLFGWTFDEIQGDDVVYHVIRHGGEAIGGMVDVDDGEADATSSRWLTLMSVDDVDTAMDRIETNGGTVRVGPRNNPTRGELALVEDSEGAVFVLLRSVQGDPTRRTLDDVGVGEWLWTELWARDRDEAIAFYGALVGYDVELPTAGESGEYRVFVADGQPQAGVNQIPWPEVLPNWLPYVRVNDPAAIAARVEELGGTVLIPPVAQVRNGTAALLMDPSGAAFAVQKWPVDGADAPGGVR
jgi:uncharacterized protein